LGSTRRSPPKLYNSIYYGEKVEQSLKIDYSLINNFIIELIISLGGNGVYPKFLEERGKVCIIEK